jgi:8-oxo-dGTP diphosphatase
LRVAAGLIHFDGKWLVAQRGPKQKMPGYWEFPGGKIEPGETPFAALVREIDEELGLLVHPERVLGEFTHTYDFAVVTLVAVVARAESGKVRLTEHQAAQWYSLGEIAGLRLAPADIPVLGELERSVSNFAG